MPQIWLEGTPATLHPLKYEQLKYGVPALLAAIQYPIAPKGGSQSKESTTTLSAPDIQVDLYVAGNHCFLMMKKLREPQSVNHWERILTIYRACKTGSQNSSAAIQEFLYHFSSNLIPHKGVKHNLVRLIKSAIGASTKGIVKFMCASKYNVLAVFNGRESDLTMMCYDYQFKKSSSRRSICHSVKENYNRYASSNN